MCLRYPDKLLEVHLQGNSSLQILVKVNLKWQWELVIFLVFLGCVVFLSQKLREMTNKGLHYILKSVHISTYLFFFLYRWLYWWPNYILFQLLRDLIICFSAMLRRLFYLLGSLDTSYKSKIWQIKQSFSPPSFPKYHSKNKLCVKQKP